MYGEDNKIVAPVKQKENGVKMRKCSQPPKHSPEWEFSKTHAKSLRTRSALSFGEGCIYPYLHYLEAEKLASSRRRVVEGRNRNYYKLTARGRKRLEALASEWERVTACVALVMEEQHA